MILVSLSSPFAKNKTCLKQVSTLLNLKTASLNYILLVSKSWHVLKYGIFESSLWVFWSLWRRFHVLTCRSWNFFCIETEQMEEQKPGPLKKFKFIFATRSPNLPIEGIRLEALLELLKLLEISEGIRFMVLI